MTIAEYFAMTFTIYLAGIVAGSVVAIVKNYIDAISYH